MKIILSGFLFLLIVAFAAFMLGIIAFEPFMAVASGLLIIGGNIYFVTAIIKENR